MKSLILVLCLVAMASAMSKAKYDEVFNTMAEYFRKNSNDLPTTVRLAFHDCVGICDGCVNTDNPENAGLAPLIGRLENERKAKGWNTQMSNADFWAISSIAAIAVGLENAGTGVELRQGGSSNGKDSTPPPPVPPKGITFRAGRLDCSTAPDTNITREFPGAMFTGPEVFAYYNQTGPNTPGFGFNVSQVVALLGAHTLGRAWKKNSGFNGPWVPNGEDKFDNVYYIRMVSTNIAWNAKDAGKDHWQLESTSDPGMMLLADFGMGIDLDLAAGTREPQCIPSHPDLQCGKIPIGYEEFVEYAEDNQLWIEQFDDVFEKMIQNGYIQGQLTDLVQ